MKYFHMIISTVVNNYVRKWTGLNDSYPKRSFWFLFTMLLVPKILNRFLFSIFYLFYFFIKTSGTTIRFFGDMISTSL